MLCADVVQARWKDAKGRSRRSTALLEDISRRGACLQLEHPIPLGAAVELHCQQQRLAGTVRYCVYREVGYFAGIEFEEGSEWSREQFQPQHLLDLKKLMARRGPRKRVN